MSPREDKKVGAVATTPTHTDHHARAKNADTGTEDITEQSGLMTMDSLTSSRINPDDPRFIRLITWGVVFAGLVAFAISFVALMEVAAWLGLPSWMHWAVPAFIDTAILIYAGSVLIHKARGEKTWPSWLSLAAFTALSVVANAAHALAYGRTDGAVWQGTVGAVIAAMVPLAVFMATEQLSRVAVEDPVSRRRELQAAAEWHAEQASRERKQLEMEGERERARQQAEIAQEEHLTRLAEIQAQREVRTERARRALETHEQPHQLRLVGTESPAAESGDLDEVAEYVRKRTAEGIETSGADLAREFGFSDKTGRRRLAKLREDRPEVFAVDDDDAEEGAAQ